MKRRLDLNAIPQRAAFEGVRLEAAVDVARAAVERARCVFRVARGKEKAKARGVVRSAERALRKAENALMLEQVGEQMAPAVQRVAIVEGVTVLREARIEVAGKRVRYVSPLDRLKKRGSLTAEQYAAGKLYRAAYDLAWQDAYPVGMGEALGGQPGSGNRRIEDAVGSGQALSRLLRLVGQTDGAILHHVIVEERDLGEWAVKAGMNPSVVLGRLQSALELIGRRG